ncbi:xanthine dehydrogenase molybdopterin binding subunit [Alphaproteobacteria bacterium LSUCC0684]
MTGQVRQSRFHDSAHLHVSGEARYTDDLPVPPDTLHLCLGLSSIAHGHIRDLKLDDVLAAPGVIGVLTAADIPGVNDASPIAGDDPIFTDDLVSYHGQSIFAVAAESRLEARRAAALARVECDPLPPVLTIEEAMSAEHYLAPPSVMQRGEPERALEDSPHRLSGEISIGGQEHFYLEGQAALALPGEDGAIHVYASTQHPTEIQHKIAQALNCPYHQVTVEVRRMGGAFGGKESQGNLPALVAALAAHRFGRPAKIVYDRDDDMRLTGKRHDMLIRYEAGFDADGRITAILAEHHIRCGMSWDLSQPIADRAMLHADNAYFLPAVRVRSHLYRTNTPSNTAFRGFGGPQGMVGMERIIDAIAHHLDLDPVRVRQKNFYPDFTKPDPARQLTPYGMEVTDANINALSEKLLASSAYHTRREEIEAGNASDPVLRRGIAFTPVKFGISFTKTFLNQAGALVHVYTDGSVQLNHGGTEMGQGLHTKIRQVVADCFAIPLEDVRITATNTGKIPNTSATAASSGTDLNGMAALNAAMAIRFRMAEYLAGLHQAAPEEVEFMGGMVRIGGTSLSFKEAAEACWMGRISLSSSGFYATPDISWDRERFSGRPFYYFAYGAAVTEVAIDTLTGENRILRCDILHDVGHSLNPAIDRGQIEGGYVQGAGWLTMEEIVYADDGRLMTHAPSTYKIPAISDQPVDFRVDLYEGEGNRADAIHRSKAVGEPPLMLGISVLMALSHAISGYKGASLYPDLNAPATPERVLMALSRMKGEGR